MLDRYIVEVKFNPNNGSFGLGELMNMDKDIAEITNHPFPGNLYGSTSRVRVLNEYVNKSALGEADKDSSLDLKYRLIEIQNTSCASGKINYILEDWLGSNNSRPLDKKKILWGRRIYTKK
jgi:hypothetical protein